MNYFVLFYVTFEFVLMIFIVQLINFSWSIFSELSENCVV